MASGKMKSVTPSKDDNSQKYDTGACRGDRSKKLNFIKTLSPLVLIEYAKYIKSFNVKEINGQVRDEDNWKLGIPRQDYIESKARHFIDTWMLHEGYIEDDDNELLIKCLCAELFNTQGYLHTLLVERLEKSKKKKKLNRLSVPELNTLIESEMPKNAYEGMRELNRKNKNKPVHYFPNIRKKRDETTICGMKPTKKTIETHVPSNVTCKTCLRAMRLMKPATICHLYKRNGRGKITSKAVCGVKAGTFSADIDKCNCKKCLEKVLKNLP